MKIKIIAIAPNDGVGFVEKEGKIFLLRPPYTSSSQIEVSRKVVENAIYSYGFEECDIALNSISNVVKYLKKTYIKSMKKQGIGLPSLEQLKELLKYATDDVLLKYLKRAKNELIPEGRLDAAESIVLDLMKLEKVQHNPEMQKMGIDILEKCNQERIKRIKRLVEEETWEKNFRLALEEKAQFEKIEEMRLAEKTSNEGDFVIGGRVKRLIKAPAF